MVDTKETPKTLQQLEAKARKNMQAKAYYENNKDNIKIKYDSEKRKAYIEANKDKIRAQQKAWREKNKEKLCIYMREYIQGPDFKAYRQSRADKKRIYDKEYRLKNIEKYRERDKAYRLKNKDKINANTRARKLRKKLALEAVNQKGT